MTDPHDVVALDAGVRAATQKCREYAVDVFCNDDWTMRTTTWDDGDFHIELWTSHERPYEDWSLEFHKQRITFKRSDACIAYENYVESEYKNGQRKRRVLDERVLEEQFCP